MLPMKALTAALRGLRSIIRDRKRSKLYGQRNDRATELRSRVRDYAEIETMMGQLLDGGSVAHYAFELGWEPPLVCKDADELNRLASAWLDARWARIDADHENAKWRTTDGE